MHRPNQNHCHHHQQQQQQQQEQQEQQEPQPLQQPTNLFGSGPPSSSDACLDAWSWASRCSRSLSNSSDSALTAEGGKHNGYLRVPSKKVGHGGTIIKLLPDPRSPGRTCFELWSCSSKVCLDASSLASHSATPTFYHLDHLGLVSTIPWISWGLLLARRSLQFFALLFKITGKCLLLLKFLGFGGLAKMSEASHVLYCILLFSLLFGHLLIHINQPHWLPLCSSTRLLWCQDLSLPQRQFHLDKKSAKHPK